MAAGGLAPHGSIPAGSKKKAAFQTVLQALEEVQPSGALWCGKLDFLDATMLVRLQQEALTRRQSAKACERHFLGCGGDNADKFAISKALVDYVRNFAPKANPTGIASYVFYDLPGCGLDPHIDTEIFSLNVLIMLRHDYVDSPSHLLLYRTDGSPQKYLLTPGEVLIFYAGGTVHAREDLKANETVSVLTIGFQKGAE